MELVDTRGMAAAIRLAACVLALSLAVPAALAQQQPVEAGPTLAGVRERGHDGDDAILRRSVEALGHAHFFFLSRLRKGSAGFCCAGFG